MRFSLQKTIAERVKLKPQERRKTGTGLKINSKQIINQTSNFISTNKSLKQFIQIKK